VLGIPRFVWLPLNLTVFLYLLYRFVGKPMGSYLESRREGIAEDLETARGKLAEAERLRAEVVARLDAVEHEVAAMKEKARRDGEAEIEQIAEQTRRDEERFLRRVSEEIARRQAETRATLARDTAELTAQLTRELLSKEMTEADRDRVMDRSLAALKALHEEE
jgi:F-type H+-transporting ATPase subunit b